MNAISVLKLTVQVILLVILMFVLFSVGSALFGLRSLAGQLTPTEASHSAMALLMGHPQETAEPVASRAST
jgi:hypothetical protein